MQLACLFLACETRYIELFESCSLSHPEYQLRNNLEVLDAVHVQITQIFLE